MKENIILFLKWANEGFYKLYKNGNIYKCKWKSNWWVEARKCKPKLIERKSKGYIVLIRRFNNKYYRISGHRFIWLYFNGTIPEGLEVNHKKGIRDNNKLSNLELVTSKGNKIHARDILKVKYGKNSKKGQEHKGSKLKDKDIVDIIKRIKKGIRQNQIAKEYGVSTGTINGIWKRRSWKHLTTKN